MEKKDSTIDLHRIGSQLRTAATWVDQVAPAVLIAVPDTGIKSDSMGIRARGISNPTADAAIGDKKVSALLAQQRDLVRAISELYRQARHVVDALGSLHAQLDLPPQKMTSLCRQEGCSRKAEVNGNCRTDDQWLRRHPEATTVPKHVIDRRGTSDG